MKKSQVRLLGAKQKAVASKESPAGRFGAVPAATAEGRRRSEHGRPRSNSKQAQRCGKDQRLENWLSGTFGGKKKRKTLKGLFIGLVKVPFEYPSIKQSVKKSAQHTGE